MTPLATGPVVWSYTLENPVMGFMCKEKVYGKTYTSHQEEENH